MDTRTGQVYDSRDAAIAAGVPCAHVAPVTVHHGDIATVRVDNGPFKGRVYELVDGKRGRRRKDLEES
jgi:hypothetical protein